MLIIFYLMVSIIVIATSIKLSYYIDLIDKKTSISGAFIGGVMLAAVTSLPELFTSLSATILLKEPGLVLGNILGSNFFNICVLSMIFIMFRRQIKNYKLSGSNNYTMYSLIIVCMLLIISMFNGDMISIGSVSLISIIIIFIYCMCIRRMSLETGEASSDDVGDSTTLSKIITRCILLSILLVISSISITYMSDIIGQKYNLGATLSGALLLGIATSLPEVTASFSLAKLNNFNALTANILGSNIFNCFILSIADISYTKGHIYMFNLQTVLLMAFSLVAMLIIQFMLVFRQRHSLNISKNHDRVFIILNSYVVVSYFIFIVVSYFN